MEKAKKVIEGITYAEEMYEVAKDADLLIVITDWNEFKEMDMERIRSMMKAPNLIDARNIYDKEKIAAYGFTYLGVGR